MKKFALVLSLVFALTLCVGAFSVSAEDAYILYSTTLTSNDSPELRLSNYSVEANGYARIDVAGSNGNSINDAITDNGNGTVTIANNADTNWTGGGQGNGSCNGTWWCAPAMKYDTAVTANQLIVALIDADTTNGIQWDGTAEFYTGVGEGHKLFYTDDPNGVWTEIEDWSLEATVHDGSYCAADWGYAGGILVYSFEEVTAKYFMIGLGEENVQFGWAYAAKAPEAATVETTEAPATSEAEATDAVATTEAEATDAVATTEAVADETTGEGAADTADFAIASVALAAVAAAGVVLCSKKRK